MKHQNGKDNVLVVITGIQWLEEVKDTGFKRSVTMSNSVAPRSIMDIRSSEHERLDTVSELNRVLGGLVRGSLTLISGDPGRANQLCFCKQPKTYAINMEKVLYVSGEESEEQIKMRGDRLNAVSRSCI